MRVVVKRPCYDDNLFVFIQLFAEQVLNLLGLGAHREDVKIVFKHLPGTVEGCTHDSYRHPCKVFLDPEECKTIRRLLKVLAHQLVHVKQYVKGELRSDHNYIYWKGTRILLQELNALCQGTGFTPNEIMPSSPWETEAYGRMDALAKAALDRLPPAQQYYLTTQGKLRAFNFY